MYKIKEFLKEYAEICKKYKLYIDGCGCCNSPYLQKFDKYIDESIKRENSFWYSESEIKKAINETTIDIKLGNNELVDKKELLKILFKKED
jgi:hypothetical protein